MTRKKKKVRPLAYVLLALIIALLAALAMLIFGGGQAHEPPKTDPAPESTGETLPLMTQGAPASSTAAKPKPPASSTVQQLDAYQASAGYQADIRNRYESYAALYPALDIPTVVKYVNMGLDRPFYEQTTPVDDPNALDVLVNKYSFLPSDYVPSDLVNLKYVDSGRNGTSRHPQLRAEAAEAFNRLSEAAAAEGLSILGYSGYRSYSYQNNLYNNYCKNDPQWLVDTYSARPGYSEHQTGLAIDVCTKSTVYNRFGNTKEYTWALENMHRFGFILSYPETENVPGADKDTYLHGYKLEEWHFRYVGEELASYLHEHGLLLDEYYALQDKEI